MKTKLLAPLLGLLLLSSCGEDDDSVANPTPAPEDLCYLQEQTIVSGDSSSTVNYTYNDLNQVTQTEHYVQGELTEIRMYTYTSEGKLADERLLAPDDQEEVSVTVYSYGPQGRLSKYEVKQRVPGLEAVHRIASFKASYDNRGRLTAANDYLYLNNKEVPNGSVTISYPPSKPVTATVKGTGGQTLHTATFAQDSSRSPLSAVPVFQQRRPGVGYPNQQNITAYKAIAASGDTVADVAGVAYTAKYTYNKQGYPLTATINYTGGRTEQVTYTYNCPD